jgi:RNA polymerase-binding transcription factor DksA
LTRATVGTGFTGPGIVDDVSDTTADTPTPPDSAAPDPGASDPGASAATTIEAVTVDLGAIERDLEAVEAALPRLDDGTYWVDEITGGVIPDGVLAENPVARRA